MNRDERFLMTHFRCAKRFFPPNVIMQATYTWWIGGNFSHFQIDHFTFRSGAESYSRKWNARKFTTTQPVISIRYFCSFCVIGMSINLSVSIVRTCNLISFQSTFCLNLTAEHDVEEKQNVPPEPRVEWIWSNLFDCELHKQHKIDSRSVFRAFQSIPQSQLMAHKQKSRNAMKISLNWFSVFLRLSFVISPLVSDF